MGMLYSQFKSLPYPSTPQTGKTVVITGANVGLGKEAARHFARLGASTLVLAVRDLDKGHAAKQDIERTTQCEGNTTIKVWKLDMASYASVAAFASRVEAELDRVDAFIANAGVAAGWYRVAEDNEESITVNVVSTFLLMGLVLPKMRQTAKLPPPSKDIGSSSSHKPVFTVVSSEVHAFTTFPQKSAPEGGIFNAVSDKAYVEAHIDDQYNVSKLLEVFGVRAIAEAHASNNKTKTEVAINYVNPGLCHSSLSRDMDSWGFWLMKMLIARSTEVGSRTLVHAATEGANAHGEYLSDCTVCPPKGIVLSEEGKEAQRRVWAELQGKLEKIKPGVTRNF